MKKLILVSILTAATLVPTLASAKDVSTPFYFGLQQNIMDPCYTSYVPCDGQTSLTSGTWHNYSPQPPPPGIPNVYGGNYILGGFGLFSGSSASAGLVSSFTEQETLNVLDAATMQPIPENGTVTKGQSVIVQASDQFTAPTGSGTSIGGYGILSSGTSGYAPIYFISGAPEAPVACDNNTDLVFDTVYNGTQVPPMGGYPYSPPTGGTENLYYATASLNPQAAPTLSTRGLTCGAFTSGQATCTVNGTSPISATVTFGSSYASLYGHVVSHQYSVTCYSGQCYDYWTPCAQETPHPAVMKYGTAIYDPATGCPFSAYFNFSGTAPDCSYQATAASTTATQLPLPAQTVTYALSLTANLPDLTAGGITTNPTTVSVNSPVTLSSMISNGGVGATPTGFTDLFQSATDANGTGATDIGTASSNALTAGASAPATLSYTFSTQGTTYVRACADKASASDAGTIAESDEANNCGAWTAVTVSGINVSCASSPNPATVNQRVTWTASNPSGGAPPYSYVWALPGGTGITGATSRVATDVYTSAGNSYTGSVTVTDNDGNSSGAISCSNNPLIVNNPVCYGPGCSIQGTGGTCTNTSLCCSTTAGVCPTVTCKASNPPAVILGQSSQINWSSSNAVSCSGTGFTPAAPALNGPWTVTPSSGDIPTARYYVQCQGSTAGNLSGSKLSSQCEDDVTVSNPSTTISANPATVNKGSTTRITWTADNVTDSNWSCTVTNSSGATLASNRTVASGATWTNSASPYSATVNAATVYTITCTGSGGIKSDAVTVTLIPMFKQF